MDRYQPMLLGELCRRIGAPPRHARYLLEEGILPAGVEPEPGHGNHRRLSPAQAFWLAIVLRLKASGVQAPLAARIADYAREVVRIVARQFAWDLEFAPFDGGLATSRRWVVEVGDLRYIRLLTDADPDMPGQVHEFPWTEIGPGANAPLDVEPTVSIRVDLARIAALLRP